MITKKSIGMSEETYTQLRQYREQKILSEKKFDLTYDKIIQDLLEKAKSCSEV